MPRIGTIPLIGERMSEPGGAAFLLLSHPTKNALISLEAGEIEVHGGQPYVVARFSPVRDASSAFSDGHSLAQQGLDLMSICGIQDAVIQNAETEHLIWWTESSGLVLRVVSTTMLKFSVPPLTAIVRDKDGNVIPSTPPTPRHHIAFRYYRLAQTTDDLFDAYRNMYLAFERLLSSQYPKVEAEREIDWLRRALRSASTVVRLDTLRVSPEPDVVEAVLNVVYRDARLPLFHAKEGRTYFAPQDSSSDRQAVSNALAVLTQIVLRMGEAWFDCRRVGGGVFFGWVYEAARKYLSEASAYASSYDGPFDPTERDLAHPRFTSAARLSSRLAPELQLGRQPALISIANGAEISQVSPLRRIDVVSEGAPYIAQILEAELHLDGISRFEDLMHIQAMNLNQPRSLFRK